MSLPLIVNPSLIGRYFFLNCRRMLRYSATPKERRKTDRVPAFSEIGNIVQRAILENGYVWEESLLQTLGQRVKKGNPVLESKRIRDLVISKDDFFAALRTEKPPDYFYQVTLYASPEFYSRYQLNPSQIQFSACRPDLLKVIPNADTHTLRVIDIKSSVEAKFSHKIQATLYALLLRDLLKSAGISNWEVDLQKGGIWLYDLDQPQEFDLGLILEPLEIFLRFELPEILNSPAHEARWSLSFRCGWCDYWEHCSKEANETQDISLLPYLRPEAKQFLQELASPVNTISELETYLQNPKSTEEFRRCAHLTGKHSRLCSDVEANQKRSIVPYGSSTIAFPKAEHIAIVMTLQEDPLSGRIFAAGMRVYGGQDLSLQDDNWFGVAKSARNNEFDRILQEFIGHLERTMKTVDDYNRKCKDWTDQKTLQCYVFDANEYALLQKMISEALAQPSLAQKALDLFFHFQTEELVSAEDHPSAEVPNPIVIMTDILRQVSAIPVHITYRLNEVSKILRPIEYAATYDTKEKFSFPLSNRMRSDALFMAWQDPKELEDVVREIKKDLESRIKSTYSVIRGLREKIPERIFAWPPKFQLPTSADFNQPVLSRLAFMTRYEKVYRYLSTRMNRTLPLQERLNPDNATALMVRLESNTDKNEWQAVLEPESEHIKPEEAEFSNFLISLANNAGDREQMRFNDLLYKDKHYVPSGIGVAYASILDVRRRRSHTYLQLKLVPGKSSPTFRMGDRCLLHERYRDFTSGHVLGRLRDLDSKDPAWLVRLLQDPHDAQQRIRLTKKISTKESLNDFLSQFTLTESQKEALVRVLKNKFQLIWGPPGTGKTHFIAQMVCALAAESILVKKSFSVLITAFTHAALEHCLANVVKDAHALRDIPQMRFSKLSEWSRGDCPSGVLDSFKSDPRLELTDMVHVVAGTVYSAKKYLKNPFDLVIIDEGSQLPVPEATIPISLVAENGRLVIAGDNKQLPPIIQGVYPEPEEGKTYLYSSIFECLRRPDVGKDEYTSQLQECFRMNEPLCRFPASEIYGEGFKPANKEVADRRLNLKSYPRLKNSWLEYVLDPEFPLTLMVIHGVHALAESPVEAELVSRIVLALRTNLLDRHGRTYRKDEDFWDRGLFVVSPHHVQILQILDKLDKAREWTRSPFVDTVDKMQGREADAVIISYGVADADYALLEGEFIYSLNRLNVAITRARTKAIVCLSAQLLKPHTIAFANDQMIEGLNFMLRLKKFVSSSGKMKEFSIEELGSNIKLQIFHF